ncbi:MAG: TonB-dependent receptor [Algicola sp.]|nr:TonB-dependent receptor [Algicola sp.]
MGTDPIVFNEKNDFARNTTLGGGEIELKYAKNSRTYIKNVLVYENRPERTNRNAIFNDQIIRENLRQQEFSLANHLEHSYLIGEKTLLHSYLHFSQNRIKQDSDIDSPVLNDFLSQSNVSRIKHKATDEATNFGGSSSFILNLGRLKTNLEIGYESINEARSNVFLITDQNVETEVDSLSNTVNFKQQTVGFKGEFEYSLSKHIELSGRLKLDHVNLEYGRLHRKRWLFNPKIRLAFKNLNIGYLSLSFGQSFNVPKSNMFLESYQLRSFQSFVLGAEDLLFPNRNRFALYYQIANDLQTKSLTVSAQYDDVNGRYSTNNQIGNNVRLTNYSFVESGQSFSTKIDFTNYYSKLNISTNLGTVQNISSVPINANNSGFQDLKTFRSSYFISATTYFDFPVNMKFKTSLNYAKSNFNSVIAKRNWQTIDAKATYKFSKVWIASLNNNAYFIEGGTYIFTDFKLEITPKKSRYSYRVIVNNILNQDNYSVVDINGFSAYRSEIRLLPRYLFASIKYRF